MAVRPGSNSPIERTLSGVTELFGLSNIYSGWINQLMAQLAMDGVPDPADIARAYRAGFIPGNSIADVTWGFRSKGIYEPADVNARLAQGRGTRGWQGLWEGVWASKITVPQPGELLLLRNLQEITEDALIQSMSLLDLWTPESRRLQEVLYNNQIPGPEELAHMAVKDCWNQAVVDRLGYDNEYPPQLDYWSKIVGGVGDARIRDAAGNLVGDPVSWARMRWRAHWVTLGPSQMYDMFQRLRPNRIQNFQKVIPGVEPFTNRDLDRGLLIADYPRTERKWLAAVAYNKPRLVDIRRLYLDGTIDRAECYELHLDYGYTPHDADLLTSWLVGQRLRALTPRPRVNPSAAALQLYQIGVASRGETRNRLLAALGGVQYSADKPVDLSNLPPAAVGQINQMADQLLATTDYRRSAKRATEILSTVRRRFLRGYLSQTEARTDLVNAGFQLARIEEYIQQWELELQGGKLLASTSAIRRYVQEGTLGLSSAKTYLSNLGWKDPELSWMLSDYQHARDVYVNQIAAREAKTRAAQTRALQQAHQAAIRQQREVSRQAARSGSPSQLVRYYTHWVINAQELYDGLTRTGYSSDGVKRALEDATIKRIEWGAKHGYIAAATAAAQIAAQRASEAAAIQAGSIVGIAAGS